LEGTPKRVDELRSVGEEQGHPILHLHPEPPQRVSQAVDLSVDLAISDATPIADERCALAPAGCDVAVHEVSGRVEAPWQRVVRIGGVSATRHVAAPARAARRPPRPPGGRSRARPGTTRAPYQGGNRDWDRAAVHADAARGAARRAGASRWRPRGPRLPARAARSSAPRWRVAPPTASGGGPARGRAPRRGARAPTRHRARRRGRRP